MRPRDYQINSARAALAAMKDHKRVLIKAPTGAGKSLIIAIFAEAMERAGKRTLILAHRKELISQNAATLERFAPRLEGSIDIASAGLGSVDMEASTIFGGIATVYRRMDAIESDPPSLLIVDEAHLINWDEGMYRGVIDKLYAANPELRILGLTATPYRLDNGPLVPLAFDVIGADIPIGMLLERGFLAPLTAYAPPESAMIPTSGMKAQKSGDFNQGAVQEALLTVMGEATGDLEGRLKIDAADRKAVLIFVPGVKVAERLAESLNKAGIPSLWIDGSMKADVRDTNIKAFKAGEVRVLINCNILTTGFDHAPIDLIVDMKPTSSLSLYIQMYGRGMRVAEGKTDCLVFDYAGNVNRHGPVDEAEAIYNEKVQRKPGRLQPAKTCPACQMLISASARECPACGYDFPPPEPMIERTPQGGILIANGSQWVNLASWYFSVWQAKGNFYQPPALKVDYRSASGCEWSEFYSFEGQHPRAATWWTRMASGPSYVPASSQEAMMRISELKLPASALIAWSTAKRRWRSEKYGSQPAEVMAGEVAA